MDAELKNLINKCIEEPEYVNELPDDDVKKISKNISLYGCINHVPQNEYSCFSITNLREAYLKRMLMTAIVGYIHRSLDEYNGVTDKTEIKAFMDSIFKFNPDYHVSKASKSDVDDERHFSEIPSDTFYRVENYMSVNYETIRKIVEHIYSELPDFDYIINVYDAFTTLEDAKSFIKKHETQFIHDVHIAQTNKWTFLGPFKENRNKIDFYNENTEPLQEILTQIESDQKLGKELMKKRVTNEKRKNIRTFGKHAEHVGEMMGNTKTVADEEEANDLSRDDNPYLRVDVFETDGADIKKSHFYTESVKPEEMKK